MGPSNSNAALNRINALGRGSANSSEPTMQIGS